MTCSDLLTEIILAGPKGYPRAHIEDLPTLEHLLELQLVTSIGPCYYWLDVRIVARCERFGTYCRNYGKVAA